jgi:hypothetical protein
MSTKNKTEITSNIILLKLCLDFCKIKTEGYNDIDVQNVIYILQHYGCYLGYKFKWKFGAINSTRLFSDYYNLKKIQDEYKNPFSKHKLTKKVRSDLTAAVWEMQAAREFPSTDRVWRELIATSTFLRVSTKLTSIQIDKFIHVHRPKLVWCLDWAAL